MRGGGGSDWYRKRSYLCRKEGTIKKILTGHKLLPAGGYNEESGHCKAAPHRLNMEVDLQSLFGLHAHTCTHWLRPKLWVEETNELDEIETEIL